MLIYDTKQVKLYQGDCLELMKDIPDGSIDAIICDPPYGTTACSWDSVIPFELMWEQLKRVIKKNGVIVLFGSQPFTSALVMSNPKMFRYEIIWEKERPTNIFFMKNQIGKVHENILIFYQNQPIYNPQIENRYFTGKGEVVGNVKNSRTHKNQTYKHSKDYDYTKRYPRSILKINRDIEKGGKSHPIQKPVALMEYLIKTYTNEGEMVLDFTMGSGTTGVACVELNRNFIGIEILSEYCKEALGRIKNAQAQGQLGLEP